MSKLPYPAVHLELVGVVAAVDGKVDLAGREVVHQVPDVVARGCLCARVK